MTFQIISINKIKVYSYKLFLTQPNKMCSHRTKSITIRHTGTKN